MPLRPTIVCRLLIDASGAVLKAEPYAARPYFEAFQTAAIAAVSCASRPARRAGTPVAVWANWPVTFQGRPNS